MKDNIIMGIGDSILVALTTIQTDAIFKLVSMILTIVTSLVTLIFAIWKWWKSATKDGKITSDEIEELENILLNDLRSKEDGQSREDKGTDEGTNNE